MSGFRKFRTTLHRRRRSVEALELGHWTGRAEPGPGGSPPADPAAPAARKAAPPEIIDLSPSQEARQIGPTPIAWLKARKPGLEN